MPFQIGMNMCKRGMWEFVNDTDGPAFLERLINFTLIPIVSWYQHLVTSLGLPHPYFPFLPSRHLLTPCSVYFYNWWKLKIGWKPLYPFRVLHATPMSDRCHPLPFFLSSFKWIHFCNSLFIQQCRYTVAKASDYRRHTVEQCWQQEC